MKNDMCLTGSKKRLNNNTTFVLKTSGNKILIKIRMFSYSSTSGNSGRIKQRQPYKRRARIFILGFEVLSCLPCGQRNRDTTLKYVINQVGLMHI